VTKLRRPIFLEGIFGITHMFVCLFVHLSPFFAFFFSTTPIVCYFQMEVFAPNGVKIYDISAGKTIPEWISEKRKKKLKKREGQEMK
jgi:hypothetical protein